MDFHWQVSELGAPPLQRRLFRFGPVAPFVNLKTGPATVSKFRELTFPLLSSSLFAKPWSAKPCTAVRAFYGTLVRRKWRRNVEEPIGVENFPIAIVIHATDLNNDGNLCRTSQQSDICEIKSK